jgi:hypothetical protein
MKAPIGIALLVFLLVAGVPAGVRAADSVDLKDLAAVGETALDTLEGVHHRFMLARILIAGAEVAEDAAKSDAKDAKKVFEAEKADEKAAASELEAARKNEDERRARLAESHLETTRKELARASALLEWKEKEADLRKNALELAKETLKLREAEMELARAELVVQSGITPSKSYRIESFRKEAAERDKKVASLSEKVDRMTQEAAKAREKWERLGG